MLEAGSQLQNRYEIAGALATGGMATVYLAHDTRLGGRPVAIKEMDASRLSGTDSTWASELFHREAQVLARLNHRGIARVTDFFADKGLLYLVMEYIEGETLLEALQRNPQGFSESQVLGWAAQLTSVLSYLHEHEPPIIFRDLKLGNVMVQVNGTLKLIDFGIARHFKPGQSGDTVRLGTPGYAAPEQYGREQTTVRSDIYSLGVLLYQMLTGHNPVSTPMNLPPVEELAPAVSPRVAQAVNQASSIEPERRFTSARSFGAALGVASAPAGGGGGQTEVLGRVHRLPRSAWIAGAITLAVSLTLLAWIFGNHDSTPDDQETALGDPVQPNVIVVVNDNDAKDREPLQPPETDYVDGEDDGTRAGDAEHALALANPGSVPSADAAAASTEKAASDPGEVVDVPPPTPAFTNTPMPTDTPAPTITPRPTATQTPQPTRCSTPVNSAFHDRYDGSLGCALHAGRSTYSALQNFEGGYMIWREDTDEIYAIYNGGAWNRFGDLFAATMPDFSCGEHRSPPTPRRGFGMIWCEHDHVRQRLGNATNGEWGATSGAQDFVNGSIINTEMGVFVLYNDGAWR